MNEDAKDLDELVFHPWAVKGPRDVLTLVSGSDFGDRGAVGVIFGVGVAFVADRGGVVGYAMGYLYIAVAAIPLCWWAYRSDEANHKLCPDCRERIRTDARVCRHCGYEFWPPAGR